jgi:hypothetical protein
VKKPTEEQIKQAIDFLVEETKGLTSREVIEAALRAGMAAGPGNEDDEDPDDFVIEGPGYCGTEGPCESCQ